MIFRRKKRSDAAEQAPDSLPGTDETALAEEVLPDEEVPDLDAEVTRAPGQGPFDVSEVPGPEGRLDLGALWLAGVPGMELRLEIDQTSSQVTAANAVLGGSNLQIQAFAAPRTMGLWDEIRSELADSVAGVGGSTEVVQGPFGSELQARMPQQGPDGRTVFAPARFIGVDGPRWFLRGVLTGQAALNAEAAEPLLDIFGQTVVLRGDGAMAPRELLSLTLPAQPGEEGQEGDEPEPQQRSTDDLNPFERGPEITEVR
ncbi:MAG: DUF3710 domain-containing protein [Micrococcales bacterium]|nr:DUF3710 domain-containing protein [Micrococcales bacterium]